MTQFNFTTNIEKRMPATGKVFCIDRMTSDYAQAHPFDVDAFIESVYQEFAGTEFEESRETLHSVWTAVLSVTSPCGDASLYPNNNGRKRAAAMKVWAKVGDYWRRGLRIGDTLPDMAPMTKITRLDDGSWIALFPKDMQLMDDGRCKMDDVVEATEPAVTEPVRNQSEPQQLDLFAFEQLQQENERLRQQLSQVQEQPRPRRQRKPSDISLSPDPSPKGEGSSQPIPAYVPTRSLSDISPQPSSIDHQPSAISPQPSATLKAIGMVAVATVALFVIYETGLLIPLGLIGLATGGLLK